jgi:hypothetical protein
MKGTKGVEVDWWVGVQNLEILPELKLWAAVLRQAYEDVAFPRLLGLVPARTSRNREVQLQVVRDGAIQWFTSPNTECPSFLWVCLILDLDPDYWREPIYDVPRLKNQFLRKRKEGD